MTKEKKIFTILTAIVLASYASSESVLGDLSQYINLNSSFEDILTNAQDNALGQLGGTLNEAAGDVIGVCYNYKPAPLKDIKISIDMCGMMDKLNIDDPCGAAPDLSSFGFEKSQTKSMDFKSFCENTMGSKKTYKLNDLVSNADFNKNLFNAPEAKQAATGVDAGVVAPSYTLADARKNQVLIDAITSNDVDTVNYYNSTLEVSDNKNPSKIDISKANVAYETPEDFYKSAQSQVEAFKKLKEQLDIKKFSENILNAYKRVNSETTNPQERIKQKQAIKGKLLDQQYMDLVNRYVRIKTKQRTMLEYRQTIAMPTKEYVEQFQDAMKPKVINAIEFQKAQLSNIISEVEAEGDVYRHKAIAAERKAFMATDEIDEAKTIAQIDKLIQ